MQFGKRSEKLNSDQLVLAFEDIEQAIAANEAEDDKKDPAAAQARAEKRIACMLPWSMRSLVTLLAFMEMMRDPI